MDSTELKGKILDIMKGQQLSSLATIKDGEPWVRYVMTKGTEDMTLLVGTFAQSRKVAQIQADPHVHLTMGARIENMETPYLQIAGTAEVLDDAETKKAFWTDEYKPYFSGPEDPNLVFLKITPTVIEYMAGMIPAVYTCERE